MIRTTSTLRDLCKVCGILAVTVILAAHAAPKSATAAELIVNPKHEQVLVRSADGKFSPRTIRYRLSNKDPGTVLWTVKSHPKWLTPNLVKGRVGQEPVVVVFSPNKPVIKKRAAGIYKGAIRFTYTRNEKVVRRNVALIVEGDPVAGAQRFTQQCSPCHSLDVNRVGPYMRGVYGRKAGVAEDFNFSDAMIAYGEVWEDRNLDRFLDDGQAVVPGNKMAFAGIANSVERMNVVTYLKSLSP